MAGGAVPNAAHAAAHAPIGRPHDTPAPVTWRLRLLGLRYLVGHPQALGRRPHDIGHEPADKLRRPEHGDTPAQINHGVDAVLPPVAGGLACGSTRDSAHSPIARPPPHIAHTTPLDKNSAGPAPRLAVDVPVRVPITSRRPGRRRASGGAPGARRPGAAHAGTGRHRRPPTRQPSCQSSRTSGDRRRFP